MDVSVQLVFQNYGNWLDDCEHLAAEQRLAELAEPLGYGTVFVVEHHFFDYSACPDNSQFLSWLAGRAPHADALPGADVLFLEQLSRAPVAPALVLLFCAATPTVVATMTAARDSPV